MAPEEKSCLNCTGAHDFPGQGTCTVICFKRGDMVDWQDGTRVSILKSEYDRLLAVAGEAN